MSKETNKEKKNDTKTSEDGTGEKPPKRKIVIETDGNNIELKKVEVAGKIELIGILRSLLENLNSQ